MAFDHTKAPFPYFGGKSRAADTVWRALGDCEHYVEPFAGSLAVLLNRPHPANRTYYSETVGDLDGLLVNFWRSLKHHPEIVARECSWPVTEADLHARHLALIEWRATGALDRLCGTPDWCDPVMAGWWVYGICAKIGAGWCSGQGPWVRSEDGRMVKRPRQRKGEGITRGLPHVSDDGKGVHSPQLREATDGLIMPRLMAWLNSLSARLRHVRIIHGPWTRLCGTGVLRTLSVRQGGMCGLFLDPPYGEGTRKGKGDDIYTHDGEDVAAEVLAWCLEHGDRPWLRVVLAGYTGEHHALEDQGWRCVSWADGGGLLAGGYGKHTERGSQIDRERLWLSPSCLDTDKQTTLWGD